MSELRALPPVIAALDTDARHALDIVNSIGNFDGRLGIQLRGSMLQTHGDALIDRTRGRGFYTIANYHLTDSPDKLALDLDALTEPSDLFGRERTLPDALTVEPQAHGETSAFQKFGDAVLRTKARGIAVIGVPDTYSVPTSSTDYIGERAARTSQLVQNYRLSALEIVYPALAHFHASPSARVVHVIVSKASRRHPGDPSAAGKDKFTLLFEGVRESFRRDAASILLGETIVKNPIETSREIIQKILDIHDSRPSW